MSEPARKIDESGAAGVEPTFALHRTVRRALEGGQKPVLFTHAVLLPRCVNYDRCGGVFREWSQTHCAQCGAEAPPVTEERLVGARLPGITGWLAHVFTDVGPWLARLSKKIGRDK